MTGWTIFYILLNIFNLIYWIIFPLAARGYVLYQMRKRVDEIVFIKEKMIAGMPSLDQMFKGDVKYVNFISAKFELTDEIFITWRLKEDGTFLRHLDEDAPKNKFWNREYIRIYKKLPNADNEEFPWKKQKLLSIWSTRFIIGKLFKKVTDEAFVMAKMAGFEEKYFGS